MKKVEAEPEEDELRPEYDLSQLQGRVRGKYAERYRAGTNLVLLEPDVAAAFPDAKTVNETLLIANQTCSGANFGRALNQLQELMSRASAICSSSVR